MTIRTIRDWRGIKHQLSNFTGDELVHVLRIAQHTQAEVDRFIESVNAELRLRAQAKPGAA